MWPKIDCALITHLKNEIHYEEKKYFKNDPENE